MEMEVSCFKISKADGNGFLDECEFNGKMFPGPNKYEPKVSFHNFRLNSPNQGLLIIGLAKHLKRKDGNQQKQKGLTLDHTNQRMCSKR